MDSEGAGFVVCEEEQPETKRAQQLAAINEEKNLDTENLSVLRGNFAGQNTNGEFCTQDFLFRVSGVRRAGDVGLGLVDFFVFAVHFCFNNINFRVKFF